MKNFLIVNFPKANKEGQFLARLSPCIALSGELFVALYHLLWFPDYFGFNWDALDECLRDFHWMEEKKITLMHEQLPKISKSDLKIYLMILNDAIEYWREKEAHDFEVIFNEADRAKIIDLMAP